ncbi:MAG: hypothetical protein FJY97_03500 [candidate division Zixibacteria bacterium]|nr:hypothetical protein [candidate division Zixibacteria bacterium]
MISVFRVSLFVLMLFWAGCASKPPPSLVAPGADRVVFETVYTYAYTLTGPVSHNLLEYRDTLAFCRLIPREKEIGVEVYNLSDNPVRIDWDEVRFVDPEGNAHPVLHELVPLADGVRRQTPSVIPPQGMLSDAITPKPYVYADITGWERKSIFPRSEAAMRMKGQTFGVILPVRQETVVTTYSLSFAVSDVRSYTVERK